MDAIKRLIVLFIALFLLNSCQQSEPKAIAVHKLKTTSSEAVNPYLTQDNKGNIVLCWTEKDAADSIYRLKYVVYNEKEETFNAPVIVTTSKGTRATAESMNKVAFKADGTVVAVFAKRFENEKNPYAGAIYYSMSFDEGKSWSESKFLHSDTSHAYGRSFFDITTLKDGEVAAIWLDGRHGKAEPGSALYFARTLIGEGFGSDKCISRNTCECCRTELLSDKDGDIHIAYRGILFPSALLGKQARDMLYTTSTDYGNTFTPVKQISKDNWAIEGCPHTGPSLAVVGKEVHALWFTAGGNPGLYYSHTRSPQVDFSPRTSMSANGKHPQIVSLTDKTLAMVWEEDLSSNSASVNKNNHHSHGGMTKETELLSTQILLRLIEQGKEKNITITDGQIADHHPVIASVDQGLLIAWVRENNDQASIYYSLVNPN